MLLLFSRLAQLDSDFNNPNQKKHPKNQPYEVKALVYPTPSQTF